MPNKLTQFWQELKRRNVVRVITVYAASAFVVLELVDILAPSLGLPGWTLNLVLILLVVGFIIAVIVSWIYDLHPEGGIVKTEPVQEGKSEGIPAASNSWKIASYISFVVIVGMIVLYVIPRAGKREVFDKSIAVLPFINESPELENSYRISAYRTAVHNNLCQIKELRVLSLESTEQYEDHAKSPLDIAKELGVGYLLSARGQILYNKIRLTVQLEDAYGEIIWSNSYDRQIELVEDHIDIQSDIAQLVARKMEATITPAERQFMDKVPTTNLTAFEYYQRGREALLNYLMNYNRAQSLVNAKHYFREALTYDPGYAGAYAGLAMIKYYEYASLTPSGRQYAADYLRSKDLDSMNRLADRAIALDPRIADVYWIKGSYNLELGNITEAKELMKRAITNDPNDPWAMSGAAEVSVALYDYVNAAEMLQKAEKLLSGSSLAVINLQIYLLYWNIGFFEKAEHQLMDYLNYTGDSVSYYDFLYLINIAREDREKAFECAAAAYQYDSTNLAAILYMGNAYLMMGLNEKAFPYYSRYFSSLELSGDLDINDMNRMGYVLSMNGKEEEANHYFKELINHCKKHIQMNSKYGREAATFDIAGVYAYQGKKDSAYYYLEQFSETNYQTAFSLAMLRSMDPLFDSIRDEPEFQQIVRDVEAKYQAEHERVRQWL